MGGADAAGVRGRRVGVSALWGSAAPRRHRGGPLRRSRDPRPAGPSALGGDSRTGSPSPRSSATQEPTQAIPPDRAGHRASGVRDCRPRPRVRESARPPRVLTAALGWEQDPSRWTWPYPPPWSLRGRPGRRVLSARERPQRPRRAFISPTRTSIPAHDQSTRRTRAIVHECSGGFTQASLRCHTEQRRMRCAHCSDASRR